MQLWRLSFLVQIIQCWRSTLQLYCNEGGWSKHRKQVLCADRIVVITASISGNFSLLFYRTESNTQATYRTCSTYSTPIIPCCTNQILNLKLPNRDKCVAVLTLRQVSLFREQSSGDIDPRLAHHSLVQGQAVEQGSPSDGFYCQAAHQSLADQSGSLINMMPLRRAVKWLQMTAQRVYGLSLPQKWLLASGGGGWNSLGFLVFNLIIILPGKKHPSFLDAIRLHYSSYHWYESQESHNC